MRTVYKFPLIIQDEVILEMSSATIRHVGEQDGRLFVWAEVDPSKSASREHFQIRGTGQPLTGKEGRFLRTVQMLNGLVFHIYHHTS